MTRYPDPKNDLTSKRIFGEHPHLLISFPNNNTFDHKTDEFYHHYQTINRYNSGRNLLVDREGGFSLVKKEASRWSRRKLLVGREGGFSLVEKEASHWSRRELLAGRVRKKSSKDWDLSW